MNKELYKHSIVFLFFTIIQVLVFQNFNLSNWGFGFVYVAFILFLPIDIPIILLLFLAFSQGIIVDVFYNTLGLHSFVIVLIAYLRSFFLRLLAPKTMDDLSNVNSISQLGGERVMLYTLLLVFIHHVFLFFIMSAGMDVFFHTLLKVIISTIISTLLILIFRKIFFNTL